jgi:hypothetical protein
VEILCRKASEETQRTLTVSPALEIEIEGWMIHEFSK